MANPSKFSIYTDHGLSEDENADASAQEPGWKSVCKAFGVEFDCPFLPFCPVHCLANLAKYQPFLFGFQDAPASQTEVAEIVMDTESEDTSTSNGPISEEVDQLATAKMAKMWNVQVAVTCGGWMKFLVWSFKLGFEVIKHQFYFFWLVLRDM